MTNYNSKGHGPYGCEDPYDLLPHRSGSAIPSSTQHEAQRWWVGGELVDRTLPKYSQHDQRGRHSPVVISDDDSGGYEIPHPVPQVAGVGQASRSARFDFNNSEQTVPWAERPHSGSLYKPRSLVDDADAELRSYLAERSISNGFLVEIDQFLRSHPEITEYPEGRDTIMQMNSSSPLEAYKFFLRGYTRPARYIDGIVKSEYFTLPTNYPYRPLRTKVDPELVEFFDGFDYRWDIIERIDKIVQTGIFELSRGRLLPWGYRRLICYAVWGNPSDAYKWFEYHLQEDYLPHRYLPEHVVLGHVPMLVGEGDPQPSSLGTSGRHMDVRFRMARANDKGIDVLQVLMKEFKAALVRKGFRRMEIDTMYDRGKARLENERQYPTGKWKEWSVSVL
ncbi:hypothetical protein C7974DRAFT_414573 [Boeremia exigua]|uniref:uncharacterized protein n=1 Tax=Boeremia exigua TaxID=749465 RepID=UPI001E8E0D1F|nr:uncharacterized protein C7974DRAFT_414573 [Boeremia exigua]KAH6621891.1 hypothetical protein C7974DRAFT_414573 [Boeremia exigua]